MTKWILFGLLLATLNAHALRHPVCQGFLPENDWNIPVPEVSAMATGITQTQFTQILHRIDDEYTPEIARRGFQLVVENKWRDGTVNAYAYQENREWVISMFGGMARHPRMTYDGFAAIACHEMGHHLGGAPLYRGDTMSVEGEADYYAMLKCLRRLFRNEDNEKILAGRTLNQTVVKQCEAENRGRQDQLLCIRAGQAGVTLGAVMASLEGVRIPNVLTPDPRRVFRTDEDHPAAQCRLDTYFQGALCRVPYTQGRSQTDYRTGACADARTYTRGLRPRCWFKPN